MTSAFMSKTPKNIYIILCLYAEDMLSIASNNKMIKFIKDMLDSRFNMKDMDIVDMILGIEISRSDGIVVSQFHVGKILKNLTRMILA